MRREPTPPSGRDSGSTGERYLPKRIRMLLTDDEYARSTQKKRADSHEGDMQFSDQPSDVRDKVARLTRDGPDRATLEERARDLSLEGVADLSDDELLEAIDAATDSHGRRKGGPSLEDHTKNELYALAREAKIECRSSMSKSELIAALRAFDGDEAGGEPK